jgi:hypothetical protein
MIRFIVIVLLAFAATEMKAQLFDDKEFYPGIRKIKTYIYNGTEDKGFWSLKTLDSLGRVITEKSYRKHDLLRVVVYKYNAQNDKILEMDISRINRATRIDTTKTDYRYNESHEIIYQKTTFNRNSSIEIRFKEALNDTVKIYQYTSYDFHQDINRIMKRNETYTITTNREHQIVIFETRDPLTHEAVIKWSSYDEHGRLQNQKMEWIPPRKIQPMYVGGPGGDDISYHYILDKKGRIRITYLIANNKKYKMAKYNYLP